MRTIFIPLAVLALAACSGAEKKAGDAVEAAANASNAASAAVANVTDYAARVAGLSDKERNAVFFRAIRDSGLQCQEITQAEQIEPIGKGEPTWRAQCDNAEYHLIEIKPDGTAIVTSRTTP